MKFLYWAVLFIVYATAIGLALTDHKTAAFLAVLLSVAGLLFGLYRFVDRPGE